MIYEEELLSDVYQVEYPNRNVMTMTANISKTNTELRSVPDPDDGLTATSRPPDTPPDAGRISGRQLTAGLGAAAAVTAVAAGVTVALARVLAPGWAHTEGLTVLIVAEVYLALAVGLVVGVGGLAGAGRLLALRRPTPRQVGAALAVTVAACAAGLAISMAFSPLSGGPVATLEAIVAAGSDQSRMAAATPLVWALIAIRVAALTGLGEELLFRGALYGWLRRRLAVAPVIAITAMLFALEHAYYPVLIPLVLSFGLAAGWVRHRTGTIGATVAMHITVDLGLFLAAVALS
jgi:membrane protease YdiL (CAAX protease family)